MEANRNDNFETKTYEISSNNRILKDLLRIIPENKRVLPKICKTFVE